MPRNLEKSFKDRLSKMKKSSHLKSGRGNWILGACKYPKTHSSFDDQIYGQTHEYGNREDNNNIRIFNKNSHNNEKNAAATLSDIDQFLIDNFKSLYLEDGELRDVDIGDQSNNNIDLAKKSGNMVLHRGSNNSFVEECGTMYHHEVGSFSSETSNVEVKEEEKEIGPDEFVAVFTFSVSPDDEFRRSMKKMVESRLRQNGNNAVGWKFMEELLFCYLNLNDKKSYKYILNAFVDLIIALREDPIIATL